MAPKLEALFRHFCIRAMVTCVLHANFILLVCGTLLLAGGIKQLSLAQTDPEPAYVRAPEITLPLWVEGTTVKAVEGPGVVATPQNNDIPYDDRLTRGAVGNLFMLIEGAFGALIMVAAGLGAIVAACMGGYKLALTLLFVAVGAFILRSLVSLFFGTDYPAYSSGGGGGGADETIGVRVPGQR